jgi:hypothetical protein
MYQVKSPILFLIFNRPKETQLLFNAIKEVKPKKLYVAADGPRNNGKDELLCKETKDILNQIDWDCELITLFREENLGCGKAVSSAITWFFENEEEGIILEDDCLPSVDFFRFTDEMLDRYRADHRVGHISGTNLLDNKRGDGDYYYSKLPLIWGWASWRRAWSKYDITMSNFEEFKKNDSLKKITDKKYIKNHLYNVFSLTYKGEINTWDHQNFYSSIVNDSVSIIPNYNMITNIGFNENGTHTFDEESSSANRKYQQLPCIIKRPIIFKIDRAADTYVLAKDLPSQGDRIVIFIKSSLKFILNYFRTEKNIIQEK